MIVTIAILYLVPSVNSYVVFIFMSNCDQATEPLVIVLH
jgi:hypothetical protein